jgi:hypothetical protein
MALVLASQFSTAACSGAVRAADGGGLTGTGPAPPGRGVAQAGGPVIVLTSTRDASDYGGRISSSPAAGFLPKDQLSGAALRRFLT